MREQMHVRIVPMTGDHLDEVAELERICFTTPWSRNMLVEELQNDCAAFLVALDDEDHVAGYAGLLVVLDEENNPVACEKQAAQVLRDGVVVDYTGALRIVRSLKEKLEARLGTELVNCAIAMPAGTESSVKTHQYVAEGAGQEVMASPFMVTAAMFTLVSTMPAAPSGALPAAMELLVRQISWLSRN